jgi:hypothetical protein
MEAQVKFIDKLRTYMFSERMAKHVHADSGDFFHQNLRVVKRREESNLISSLPADKGDREAGYHYPAIDFDGIPVRFVESSTPGNFHLYIDKKVHWDQYTKLLEALAVCRLVQRGFVEASLSQGSTTLRTRPDKKGYPLWEPARIEVTKDGMEYFPRSGNAELEGISDVSHIEAALDED